MKLRKRRLALRRTSSNLSPTCRFSDYELSRLDKIKANNQDLGTRTVGFWGPDVQGAVVAIAGAAAEGAKSGVSSTPPVWTSARLQHGYRAPSSLGTSFGERSPPAFCLQGCGTVEPLRCLTLKSFSPTLHHPEREQQGGCDLTRGRVGTGEISVRQDSGGPPHTLPGEKCARAPRQRA